MKANRKIMKTKPEVTDEEIRGFMNFDKLLTENHAIELRRKGISKLAWSALAIVLITSIGTVVYLSAQNDSYKIVITKKETSTPATPSTTENKVESENKIPEEKSEGNPEQGNEIKSTPLQEKEPANKTVVAHDSTITPASVYREAEPVAGFPHLYEYFNNELTYPKEAIKDSIRGVVTVSFIISKEGKPEEVKIIHSLGIPFDQEVYRLIEQMPAWKPATMNGQPTRAKISLPLTFRLEKRK